MGESQRNQALDAAEITIKLDPQDKEIEETAERAKQPDAPDRSEEGGNHKPEK